MPIRWIALLAVLAAPPAAAGDVPLTTLSDRERRTLDRYLLFVQMQRFDRIISLPVLTSYLEVIDTLTTAFVSSLSSQR